MVSKIMKNGDVYYCSNCRMRLFQLSYNCKFCGNLFSNYEDIIIKEEIEHEKENKDESNIYGRN